MALATPPYIRRAGISSDLLKYRWDEWNVKSHYTNVDHELFDRLCNITHRAKVAMTIAAAEWIVARFDAVSKDAMPRQYLEAAWAGNVDQRYARYIETNDDEWRGPVRGPLNMAITIVADSLFCADESEEPAENPAWMCTLAEHVLPAREGFDLWRHQCVERLERFYSAEESDEEPPENDEDAGDFGGDPVPCEVFDPEFEFTPAATRDLTDRYLRSLDYSQNHFLRSPAEMAERGFTGTPYML
jgi:hypothetical protein